MKILDFLKTKSLIKYLKIIILVLLAVTCILIPFTTIEGGTFVFTFIVAIALIIIMAIKVFAIKDFYKKIPLYVVDGILLVLLTMFATLMEYPLLSSSYIYLVYALVLSEFYLSSPQMKANVIMFGTLFFVYTVEYAVIAFVSHTIEVAFDLSSRYFTDIIILVLHFVIFNFAMTVYRKNKQIEKTLVELEESKNQLLKAYDKLEEATLLEERNRIAKEIHDTAGHSLTTVIMQTEAARLVVDKNVEEAKKRIISANLQAKTCLEELRASVHLLSGRRENTTFKEFLESIIAESCDNTGITVRSKIDDVRLTDDAERFVSNLLREGISNGIRHGASTAFFFELKDMGAYVEVLLSDNGKGASSKTFKEGFGLSAMRKKAEKLGGIITFDFEEGEGFEIRSSLPESLKVKGEKNEN